MMLLKNSKQRMGRGVRIALVLMLIFGGVPNPVKLFAADFDPAGGSFGGGGASGSWDSPSIPFGIPFGGMMLAIVPCLCSGGILGVVGPPRPGVFVLQPGVSFLYSYFQWRPGSWQLGLAAPGGVCMIPAPHSGCMALPAEGTVIIDGTSL